MIILLGLLQDQGYNHQWNQKREETLLLNFCPLDQKVRLPIKISTFRKAKMDHL
jgi:hypothetical protein